MMFQEIFQIDSFLWTPQQTEIVREFILFNSYLSKIYSPQHFKELISILIYQRIPNNQIIALEGIKKPLIIILLSGKIAIKKYIKIKNNTQEITVQVDQRQYNSSIIVDNDCRIVGIGQKYAQFIYISKNMYQNYTQNVQRQRLLKISSIISKNFPLASKKQVKQLSQFSRCESYKINHHIYNIKDPPAYVYLLLEGNVRIQKNKQIVVLSPNALFGRKDIHQMFRQQSAICCSAHVKVLMIPKKQYLNYFDNDKLHGSQIKMQTLIKQGESSLSRFPTLSLRKIKSNDDVDSRLTKLIQGYQFNLPDEQSKEFKLLKNSHNLQEISVGKKMNKNRKNIKSVNIEVLPDLMQTKYDLFKKLRPNPFIVDLNHRLF